MKQVFCTTVSGHLKQSRHSSSTARSCTYNRPCKPVQVAVININRIPAPTASMMGRGSKSSVGRTPSSHGKVARNCRLSPSDCFPANPAPGGVNLGTGSARVSNDLPKTAQAKINHLVSSPFKQSSVPRLHHMHFSPGEELKYEILSEIEKMKNLLSSQRPVCERRLVAGQLLKARMKPLCPTVVEGPSISQCLGILPVLQPNHPRSQPTERHQWRIRQGQRGNTIGSCDLRWCNFQARQ
ncbi:uncharacterized protein LOC132402152 isoform X2 [Hypanus sabinus]|uniref:uncharacterized protein LOC132402152 isoform X2 n=1 Tax=Hypanus sabinus TaxID=79690 RepID=UPI0028C37B59|nr:uncharacterized protein LOC132402152 isoform X2 [Hypanus sabinus]